jgi:hypothetical protein
MEPACQQLSLPLFDPPPFEDLLRQRRPHVNLSIIVNRRFKRGWQVKVLPFSGKRQLSIPPFLSEAPEDIKNCLIEWALLPCRPRHSRKKAVREQRSLLEKRIWAYIEVLPDSPARNLRRFDPGKFSSNTRGSVHDLKEVFDHVNRSWFNGSLLALVRWGHRGTTTSYHTSKNDAHGLRFNLITIAGAYNHPEVPRFAIEAIMHHEMLHIAVPPYKKNGRSVIHGKEFKNSEKKFHTFREWKKWEREKLPALIKKGRR